MSERTESKYLVVAVKVDGKERVVRVRPSDYIWQVSCLYLVTDTDAGYDIYGDAHTQEIFAIESGTARLETEQELNQAFVAGVAAAGGAAEEVMEELRKALRLQSRRPKV